MDKNVTSQKFILLFYMKCLGIYKIARNVEYRWLSTNLIYQIMLSNRLEMSLREYLILTF